MWKCKKCSERIEDNFDACWNCGCSREGVAADASDKEAIKTNKKEAAYQNKPSANSSTKPQEVVVVDISVPFWSMVVFMVKWSIASIPAFFILLVTGMVFIGMFGLGALFFR